MPWLSMAPVAQEASSAPSPTSQAMLLTAEPKSQHQDVPEEIPSTGTEGEQRGDARGVANSGASGALHGIDTVDAPDDPVLDPSPGTEGHN